MVKDRLSPAEDRRVATAVFALFSLILAACAVALGWAGVKDAVDGDAVGGAIGIAIGATVLYGAYLFARTAWRARRAMGDNDTRLRQSRDLRFFACYIGVGLAVALVLPVAGLVKVILVVMFVGGTVVAMAARVDPPRRSKR
jgi:hypothetical protein